MNTYSDPIVCETDPTPTQQLWNPIYELTQAHLSAIQDLNKAVIRGDEVLMKKASDDIQFIQDQLHLAHVNVLEYERQKSARRVQS